MSKLIVYTQEGKRKSIGVNPHCTDEEIESIAEKLVPEGIEYQIITEEEYNNIPEVVQEKALQECYNNRIRGYGTIGDQLDMIFHELKDTGSISTSGEWFNNINTVKLNNIIGE